MSEAKATYLDTFPNWLRSLGEDAEKMASLLEEDGRGEGAREAVAGGLNYLFKSLDLIPDGIDDIGFLDDAFVIRVAAEVAAGEDSGDADADKLRLMASLANDCELVRQFLADPEVNPVVDYDRLLAYVRGLRKGAARGRAVSDILADPAVRDELVADVRGFARSYEAPSFAREEKNLIKLKAFFDAKLPK
ncbi:MAG: YkvA family protein [Sandaracinaceae bacterium]